MICICSCTGCTAMAVDAGSTTPGAKPGCAQNAGCGETGGPPRDAPTLEAGPYPSLAATPQLTPAPKMECGPCIVYGPCAYAKRGCRAGDGCAYCHDQAHTRRWECKPLREANCGLCRAKGPCAALRGTCAQGRDCGFCHSHALAPGRSSEFQRAVRRHQAFQHQQKATAAHTTTNARPSYRDPTMCSCSQCGLPQGGLAWQAEVSESLAEVPQLHGLL
jgi:hypothetical protein